MQMNLEPPFLILTDSYKAGHNTQYPKDIEEMTAYMECRGSFGEIPGDDRIVVSGVRYFYEKYLMRRITQKDIQEADLWYSTHGVGKSQYEYPRDLWISVIEENDGWIPLTVEAFPDGSVIYKHVPFIQVTTKGKYVRLIAWFESLWTQMWSPIVTATKSAMVKDYLTDKFRRTVDESEHFLLNSRFHDFGFRGTSSVETAMVTGLAHLLSFEGTDTQPAGWLATQFNQGIPIGESVIASEHSVMTSWDNEVDAALHIIDDAPDGAIVSIVADSYDYDNFLDNIVPLLVEPCRRKGVFLVVRPDSGEPVLQIEKGLIALEKHFGVRINSLGYKVIEGAGLLQGDGLDYQMLCRCADAVEHKKFAAQCVAYGMGGGLLQKQNRDTLKIATKLCRVVLKDGTVIEKMKSPKSDLNKRSLPGKLQVWESDTGGLITTSAEDHDWTKMNKLEVIWDCRPTTGKTYTHPYYFEPFVHSRQRLAREWNRRPRKCEVVSEKLQAKINAILATR